MLKLKYICYVIDIGRIYIHCVRFLSLVLQSRRLIAYFDIKDVLRIT